MLAVMPEREIKIRVNTCFYPTDLRKMDKAARELGVSRSELLEYCFRFWLAAYEGSR